MTICNSTLNFVRNRWYLLVILAVVSLCVYFVILPIVWLITPFKTDAVSIRSLERVRSELPEAMRKWNVANITNYSVEIWISGCNLDIVMFLTVEGGEVSYVMDTLRAQYEDPDSDFQWFTRYDRANYPECEQEIIGQCPAGFDCEVCTAYSELSLEAQLERVNDLVEEVVPTEEYLGVEFDSQLGFVRKILFAPNARMFEECYETYEYRDLHILGK